MARRTLTFETLQPEKLTATPVPVCRQARTALLWNTAEISIPLALPVRRNGPVRPLLSHRRRSADAQRTWGAVVARLRVGQASLCQTSDFRRVC